MFKVTTEQGTEGWFPTLETAIAHARALIEIGARVSRTVVTDEASGAAAWTAKEDPAYVEVR